MFGDIKKTLSLVDTPTGAPNFLLALALCCYTEYWGQFLIGKKRLHGYNSKCFNEFFKRLGNQSMLTLSVIIIINMILLNAIIIYTRI